MFDKVSDLKKTIIQVQQRQYMRGEGSEEDPIELLRRKLMPWRRSRASLLRSGESSRSQWRRGKSLFRLLKARDRQV